MASIGAIARRARLGRLFNRALSSSSSDAGGDDAPKLPEPPVVFSRSKKGGSSGMRYLVMAEPPPASGSAVFSSPALDILESSALGTPLPGPAGAPHRYMKLPHPSTCNKVLNKAVQESHGASVRAAGVAEVLLLQGIPLEPSTLKVLIAGLAKAQSLEAVLPVLDAWLVQQVEDLEGGGDDVDDDDEATQAPLQVMTLLMDAAARAEHTQLVLQVLSRMARIGVTPSPQSLTTLLQCFMRLGQVNVAHSVLDWMRRNGLEPNVFSYTALLAMPRKATSDTMPQLLEQARGAYEKMRSDGVPPNARFFTEYLRICGRAGSMQAAEAAWRDARAAGVQPDLYLYSAMIDACAKCRDADAALRVFREMQQRGGEVQPDVVAYTSLLTALQGAPQAAATARELWRGMAAAGVAPNGMAVAAFLEILLLEGEVDEALQTLASAQPSAAGLTTWQRKGRRLAAAAGFGWEDEEAAPEAAAALEVGEAGGAAAARGGAPLPLKHIVLQGDEVDLPRLYEHFIFAMAHKGQYAVVEQMAGHMRSRGLQQTLGTASALLTAQALQQGRTAAKWLLQPFALCSSQGGSGGGGGGGGRSSAAALRLPDQIVESCLLGRASPLGCMQQLLEAGGRGRGGSGGSGTGVANVVLAGLAVRGCTAEALQLFDWMQQQQQQLAAEALSPAEGRRPGEGKGSGGGGSRARTTAAYAAVAAAAAPDWWTLQLLLYTALNAPREQQLLLTLRAVREARVFGGGGVEGELRQRHGWDRRTRAAIAAVLRQSEAARALGLGPGWGGVDAGGGDDDDNDAAAAAAELKDLMA